MTDKSNKLLTHPSTKYSPYVCINWLIQHRDEIKCLQGACIMVDGCAKTFGSPMEHRDVIYLSKIIEMECEDILRQG